MRAQRATGRAVRNAERRGSREWVVSISCLGSVLFAEPLSQTDEDFLSVSLADTHTHTLTQTLKDRWGFV